MKLILFLLTLLTITMSVSNEYQCKQNSELFWDDEILVFGSSITNIVAKNAMFDVYSHNFVSFVNIHASRCGIVNISNDKQLDITYLYNPQMLPISIWHSESNWLYANTFATVDIIEWVEDVEKDLIGSGLSEEVSIDEYMEIWLIIYSWKKYTDWLQVRFQTSHSFDGTDLEEAINGMCTEWGIYLEPSNLESDLRIEYYLSTHERSVATINDQIIGYAAYPFIYFNIYYGDIEIDAWSIQIEGISAGEWWGFNEDIIGEIFY